MELKMKQRLIGLCVLTGVVLLVLPFLLHEKRPATTVAVSTNIPAPPQAPTIKTIASSNHDALPAISVPSKLSVKTQQAVKTMQQTMIKKSAVKNQPIKHSAAIKKQIKVVQPIVSPVKKSVSSSVKKATNSVAWTIQLGVFSDKQNATNLVKGLRKKGYDTYLRSLSAKGKRKLTVVFVGPEISLEKIKGLQKTLKNKLHLNGVIRKYQL